MRCRIPHMAMLTVVAMVGVISNAEALKVYNYSSVTNDRFSSGYPGAPVKNTNFFAASYDWSGVGWDKDKSIRNVAMISDKHFVCATHYTSGLDAVTFFNRDGELRSNTVSSYTYMTSFGGKADLTLGEFSSPFSTNDKITYYPVLWFTNENSYLNRELYVYGWTARAGTNTVDGFNTINSYTRCFRYDYDHITGEAGGQGGDSGSPTFIPWGGQLTVFGTKFAVSDTNYPEGYRTYDSSIPYYVEQLNTAMGQGYYVTLVPEPSAFFLLASGIVSLFACMRIRFKKD